MTPTLRPGDRLLVSPLAGATPPCPGEIVVARRGSRLVAHRLVLKVGTLAITRGDACRSADPPIALQSLLGRVVRIQCSSRWQRPWRRLKLMLERMRRSL